MKIRHLLAVFVASLGHAATFTVNTTADSGPGSLRQAITEANARSGFDTIEFAVPPGGTQTIFPLSPLPVITEAVRIDGTTQLGYVGTPIIELNGERLPAGNGLHITAHVCIVRGLAINRFPTLYAGISLEGGGGHIIEGCHIGTDLAGTMRRPNDVGISLSSSDANIIGSGAGGSGNIISGNARHGVLVTSSQWNRIQGNAIGTALAAPASVRNGGAGILLDGGSRNNLIGGTALVDQNWISGNYDGVEIANAHDNQVQGNLIGPDGGDPTLANGNGVFLHDQALGNLIGGTVPGAGNIIFGGVRAGIFFSEFCASNSVQGNLIGTEVSGFFAMPNHFAGVAVWGGSHHNLIGGSAAGAGNVISGNEGEGVLISDGADNNRVEGNRIGTTADGRSALPNGTLGGAGVAIFLSRDNVVGGPLSEARNIISGNHQSGVGLFDATNTHVLGNYIGLDVDGAVLANETDGVRVARGTNNMIGGDRLTGRNVISGNGEDGVHLDNARASFVLGNFIGVDRSGAAAAPNGHEGVHLENVSTDNVIGGTAGTNGNVISGNLSAGVLIEGHSLRTRVLGNFIGTDVTGTMAVPNAVGVTLSSTSSNYLGSAGVAEGNLISGNRGAGVNLRGNGGSYNVVVGNFIGTDVTGGHALGNSDGVLLDGVQHSLIGGNVPAARNVIAANRGRGIWFDGGTLNRIEGNFIGTDSTGARPLGNGRAGVDLAGASANVVGGLGAGAGNRIAYNRGAAVLVPAEATGNAILSNEIFANGALGIDLEGGTEDSFGVTANDPIDLDGGANTLQNFPVLDQVTFADGMTTIRGHLDSAPDRSYLIQLFRNISADSSGHGQGEAFLGTTGLSADRTFTFAILGAFYGQHFTATATDTATGDTSEFSEAVQEGADPVPEISIKGDDVLVSFRTGTSQSYRLERTDSLSEPRVWTSVAGAEHVPGTGGTVAVTDSGAARLPMRFYRVALNP